MLAIFAAGAHKCFLEDKIAVAHQGESESMRMVACSMPGGYISVSTRGQAKLHPMSTWFLSAEVSGLRVFVTVAISFEIQRLHMTYQAHSKLNDLEMKKAMNENAYISDPVELIYYTCDG